MKKIMLITIMMIVLGLIPQHTYALSCAGPETALKEFKNSDVVFHGFVKEYKENSVIGKEVYIIEIKDVYKGEITESIIKGYDSTGGFWLSEIVKEGNEYLFYGQYGDPKYDEDKNKIYISPCGKTTIWEQGKNQIKEFPISKDIKKINKEKEKNTKEHNSKPFQKEKVPSVSFIIMGLVGVTFLYIIIRIFKHFYRR